MFWKAYKMFSLAFSFVVSDKKFKIDSFCIKNEIVLHQDLNYFGSTRTSHVLIDKILGDVPLTRFTISKLCVLYIIFFG